MENKKSGIIHVCDYLTYNEKQCKNFTQKSFVSKYANCAFLDFQSICRYPERVRLK